MATNNRIKVSDLDYNDIRANLKTFMSGQSQFTDYDFDGSALSTLIDILAYNTHYNALYTNLAINEMFLDSASKRSSLVSIANNFGYTARSVTTARALLNIANSDVSSITTYTKSIPKGSSFTTSIDGSQYTFWTLSDYTATRSGTQYFFQNVAVYEGLPQTQVMICTEADQKFILPNANIDLDTITLTVQLTGERPEYEKYTRAQDVLELKADSKIYFIKELEDGTYQLYFGSNNLGKSIDLGNIITIEYLISSKTDGNGGYLFNYTGNSIGGELGISTVSRSYSGKDKETSDEIRFNVSQKFFDQNRTVTPGDYKEIVKREYSNIDSISVWGGEDHDPPTYGKVFLAIKPTNSLYLTPSEKSYILENIIKPRSVVSVTPEFIDPTYIELEMNTTIYYNKNKTTRSADQLRLAVIDSIQTYTDTNLKKFDGIFRMSKYSTAMDNVDQSILSSISTFRLFIEITPKYNIYGEYKFNLINPIYSERVPEEAISSTGFYIDDTTKIYKLDDDGVGNIRLVSIVTETGEKNIVNPSIGSVDYAKGLIKISNLRITNLVEPNFYLIIKTSSYDVASVRNQIVDIPASRVTVNILEDATASGTYLGGTNYKFTSSRN